MRFHSSKQIPGIEIVGNATQECSDQEPAREQEWQDPLASPSTLSFHQTSPHVLLNFAGESYPQALEEHSQLANPEIPGPYTASLLEKIVDHKNGHSPTDGPNRKTGQHRHTGLRNHA